MKKQILEIKVGRDAEGCYLSLRSEISLDVLALSPSDPAGAFSVAGVLCNKVRPEAVPAVPFTHRANPNAKLFVADVMNSSFLLARDIRNGVTFRLDGPVSVDKMKLFVAQMKQLARACYVEHLKPVNMVCTLTVSEQEIL